MTDLRVSFMNTISIRTHRPAPLSDDQKKLRGFYGKLLNTVNDNEAFSTGKFYELLLANQHRGGFDERIYCYMRYTDQQRILIIVNFDRQERGLNVLLPDDLLTLLSLSGEKQFTDLLTGNKYAANDIKAGLDITLPAMGGVLLSF